MDVSLELASLPAEGSLAGAASIPELSGVLSGCDSAGAVGVASTVGVDISAGSGVLISTAGALTSAGAALGCTVGAAAVSADFLPNSPNSAMIVPLFTVIIHC